MQLYTEYLFPRLFMSIEAVIYVKHYDLQNVKQLLHRHMTLLVTSYCLTITYDREGFMHKSPRKMSKNILYFSRTLRILNVYATVSKLRKNASKYLRHCLKITVCIWDCF